VLTLVLRSAAGSCFIPLGQQSSTRVCTTQVATVVVHVHNVGGRIDRLRHLAHVAPDHLRPVTSEHAVEYICATIYA
jgi:hypothetical protein